MPGVLILWKKQNRFAALGTVVHGKVTSRSQPPPILSVCRTAVLINPPIQKSSLKKGQKASYLNVHFGQCLLAHGVPRPCLMPRQPVTYEQSRAVTLTENSQSRIGRRSRRQQNAAHTAGFVGRGRLFSTGRGWLSARTSRSGAGVPTRSLNMKAAHRLLCPEEVRWNIDTVC
jgi:hypothetical protein